MDMLSFKWEWCETRAAPYPATPWDGRTHGAIELGDAWVLRGGDTIGPGPGTMVRHFDVASARDANYGFRCAK